jgi:NSS family neurotransmitter:Na+ symporter
MLFSEIRDRLSEGYGGLPDDLVLVFRWGVQVEVIVAAVALSFIPWRKSIDLGYDAGGEIPTSDATVSAGTTDPDSTTTGGTK